MTLSVIIPVYNVENYLKHCLDSVFALELDDFEVICVNDGSPDKSQSIIDKYAECHPNIRCIKQNNGGLSDARNTGLQYARGEYVFFLDADDSLMDALSLGSVLSMAQKKEVDLCVFNASVNGEKRYLERFPVEERVLSGKDVMKKFLSYSGEIIEPVWAHLYKRRFLDNNHLQFKKGIFHEDVLFTPQALYLSQRCLCIDVAVVNYRCDRPASITSLVSIKHLIDKRDIARDLFAFFDSNNARENEPYRIVIGVYFEVIQSALANKFSVRSLIEDADKTIMRQCIRTEYDRKCYRLSRISSRLMDKYRSNNLPILLRKAINRFM